MHEMPTLTSMNYGQAAAQRYDFGGDAAAVWQPFPAQPVQDMNALLQQAVAQAQKAQKQPAPKQQPQEGKPMSDRRLVRVLVVDPHKDVPTESALIFDSKELFTDKTDQELYFDVAIGDLLKAHNEKRTKIVDKSVKDRTEYLEAARIRDLNMLVITLAKF